ncbi:MAG: phosphatidate cytidylyltransferase [Betaproteobacteria bacterium]|nr:phosphatidate cytidylyltransferase [Betaproteobacteria bacterium]
MLKTRILTAAVLLAIFIPSALFLPDLGWTILISVVVGVAAWEWAGLAGFGSRGRIAYVVLLFYILFIVSTILSSLGVWEGWASLDVFVWLWMLSLLACLFWFVVVPLWFRFRWQLKGMVGLVVGIFVLIPAWLGVVISPNKGMLLFIISIAWVADIAAYITGRLFGKHKLAPTISPGKTWEGAVGAFVAVFFYLYIWFLLAGGYGDDIPMLLRIMFLGIAFVLTAACILGDLFESLLKRQAGVKDSSNFLPGHGGVLDRIDSLLALLAVFPVVWRLYLILVIWILNMSISG